jgi:sialic acid synthase SpsE
MEKRSDPYFIAEVGSNWKKYDDILNSVIAANSIGCDAVKFQVFTYRDLFGVDGKLDNEFPVDRLAEIHQLANTVGIDLLLSAFSVKGLEMVDPYVKIHKIASSKVTDPVFVETAFAFNKPVMVSDGMSNPWQRVELMKMDNFIHMLCVSEYPAEPESYDLTQIVSDYSFGLSDHTLSNHLAKLLRANGFTYFEKHVDFIGCPDSPDKIVSVEPWTFLSYMEEVRKVEVGRPKRVKAEAHKKWADVWHPDKKGFFRPGQ